MLRVIALSVIFLVSCSQPSTHVYEVREVVGTGSQFYDKGAVSYQGFLAAFRAYPWAEQVGIAAALEEQHENEAEEDSVFIPGPAIKVTDTATDGASMFVSAIGSADAFGYIVGIIYPKAFALELEGEAGDEHAKTKTELVRWAELFMVKPAALVERYAEKFFAGDAQSLLEYMRKAPPFASGEASEIVNLEE
ncbi:MAG: hypothetical protein AB8C02_01915 [Halioglobus sp.]